MGKQNTSIIEVFCLPTICHRYGMEDRMQAYICIILHGIVFIRHTHTRTHNYNDVTWASLSLNHRQYNCLCNMLFRLATKKTPKLSITGPLWGESIGDQWIPPTNGQLYWKHFHVRASIWVQWNLSATTTPIIKSITCDLFSNVF